MINKTYYNDGRTCRVTFRICPDDQAEAVHLVSDRDDWSRTARPLARRKDGCFSTSLVLRAGERVQFRYLIDEQRWINDDQADEYVDNTHGETDGVIRV
jgi:1,4-alpha-glucan branching enzyme